MYYYEDHDWNRQQNLNSQILKAINGEYEAIHCYAEIVKMAPSSKVREVVEEIRQDEIRHYETFSKLYVQLTGSQPQITKQPKCSNQYLRAIDEAFLDEQETVDFYHTIANETTNSMIRSAFRRAAEDEQNHAVWFLYFLMKKH
jgi:rubrerythrin